MSLVKRIDAGDWWGPVAALVMILALAAISFVLLHGTYPPVGASWPMAVAPAPAPDEQVAPEAAQGRASAGHAADERTADEISASEQVTFKSRRAVETIDPRELLRRGAAPTGSMLE